MVHSDTRVAWQLFHLNWIPIAVMGGFLLFTIALTDFSLEPVTFGITAAIAVFLGLTAYLYAFARADLADPKLVFSLGTIAQVILVTAIVGPLSYVAGATNWPLQDHAFLAIDRALGMDPEWIARFVNDHGWLAEWLNRGYGFIKWPLLGIPIILTITLRLLRLQLFMLALCLALAVTIAISALAPAIGTYYGLHISPAGFPFVNSTVYAAQLRDIIALREGSLRHLELFKLAGIVSFPSFHAASGVLYMWALWPVRGIGGLAVALNMLMIAATPVIGAHYMIDVIGGVALAAFSILLAKYCLDILAPSPAELGQADPVESWRPRLGIESQ
jgi:membrane-associated phospholipid phosphatase